MDCIFCKIAKKEVDAKILYEDDKVVMIMDAHPVVDGHTLIIPKEHYTDYQELDKDILAHIFDVAKSEGKKILEKLDAKALTLLINYGDSQKVKHFHLHLLPEFSSSNTCTKTVEEVYQILK